MLKRLVLAIKNKDLESSLEAEFSGVDTQVECYGSTKNPWLNAVQSCGDIIIVSEKFIPGPIEYGIAMINDLPEKPTTVVLHGVDSSQEHAKIVAAGADVVLYERITIQSLIEAIYATLESRQQLIQMEQPGIQVIPPPRINDFSSENEEMQLFLNQVLQVAPTNSSLLLLGETGVGKEHLAKAIHAKSKRSGGPFVTVNTAALPEHLLESELFGHKQGAFTGAVRSRRGSFELAHGGTIFLDEIGEMPLHLQSKLLRVLQDFEVKPVGSENSIWVDVRVVAATNRDLEEEVTKGNFRKDLYYRLNVMTLIIPPLRQRQEDIPALAQHFLRNFRYKIGREVNSISESAMEALCQYDWPGNVRELMNVIERAMLLSKGKSVSIYDLPNVFHLSSISNLLTDNIIKEDMQVTGFWKDKSLAEVKNEIIDRVEILYFDMVLKQTKGRIREAAGIAKIHTRALYNKMRRLGLKKEDYKGK
ncbi:MAG: sigma-54 dependent transcriptional regulator [Proteobacteria bacterium]|nr:sigma-54 dependent transcriptional regulator [Pseudomonadota bacterium]MBU1716984.1 sigma-54 dependent transcriptional regulator [Pseudomonadota bacterium]